MADEPVRIAIAHDQPIFRTGLSHVLESDPHYAVIGAANADLQAVALVEQHRPDVLLLDCSMPHGNGLDVLRAIANRELPVRTVIVVTDVEGQHVVSALKLGARGVVPASVSKELLLRCIHAVMDDQYWVDRSTTRNLVTALKLYDAAHAGCNLEAHELSPREREIVAALLRGESNKNIARDLGIAEQTVKNHLHELYGRFDVSSRLGLALAIGQRDLP